MKKIIEEKPEKTAEPYVPELGHAWKERQAEKTAEAEAAEKIAGILGIAAEEPEAHNIPLADNAGVMKMNGDAVPTPMIELEELAPAQLMAGNRDVLKLYNRVIDALRDLQEDEEACKAKLASRANIMEQEVRRLRIQVFEPVIDWNALAGQD